MRYPAGSRQSIITVLKDHFPKIAIFYTASKHRAGIQAGSHSQRDWRRFSSSLATFHVSKLSRSSLRERDNNLKWRSSTNIHYPECTLRVTTDLAIDIRRVRSSGVTDLSRWRSWTNSFWICYGIRLLEIALSEEEANFTWEISLSISTFPVFALSIKSRDAESIG